MEQAFPFSATKAPQYRQRCIVLHQIGGGEPTRQPQDGMIGQGVPLQIVDEPSHLRLFFHPSELLDQLFIRKMMAEQGREKDIRLLAGKRYVPVVCLYPVGVIPYPLPARHFDTVRIAIDASDPYFYLPFPAPPVEYP